MNNNQSVIDSKKISSTGGVRDPHILRGEEDKTFHMVLTDMTSSKGWDSNRAMVLLKSHDLIAQWGKPEKFTAKTTNPVLKGSFADPYTLYSNKTPFN